MRRSNVAVISSNTELLNFFELELLTMGFEVSALQSLAESCDNYDFLIIDTDTVSTVLSAYNCPVVCVSAAYNGEGDGTLFLPWPVSVHRIAECCRDVYNQADGMRNSDKENILYVIDKCNGIAVLNGMHVKLSKTEFKIMKTLCRAKGEIVTREQLMQAVGADKGNISDVYICRLRKKLECMCEKQLIYTERSVGYYTVLRMTE